MEKEMTPEFFQQNASPLQRLLTIKEAAEALGCHPWQLQRAVKRGDIPHYTPYNSRRLIKLSEVVAYIDATRQGGELMSSREHQLELNFDDPVEYLAPPTYLVGVQRTPNKPSRPIVGRVETRVIVEHLPVDPETGRSDK
jgi:excisionase family DNA binding protein